MDDHLNYTSGPSAINQLGYAGIFYEALNGYRSLVEQFTTHDVPPDKIQGLLPLIDKNPSAKMAQQTTDLKQHFQDALGAKTEWYRFLPKDRESGLPYLSPDWRVETLYLAINTDNGLPKLAVIVGVPATITLIPISSDIDSIISDPLIVPGNSIIREITPRFNEGVSSIPTLGWSPEK